MNISKLVNQPEEITPVLVEAVLMPNGEVITLGKSIGFYRDYEGYLYKPNAEGSKT